MRNRLTEVIAGLGRPRVFVMGDMILDRYVWGTVERVSPEAPVQILKVAGEENRAGGASNVALNLVTLGARVSCGGVVGRDDGGRELLGLLRRRGVGCPAVVSDPRRPTPVKTRMIAHNQQMLRVDREDTAPIGRDLGRRLLGAALREAARSDLAVISDYHKGTLPPELCRRFVGRAGCPVVVGLKSRDYRKYAGATGASINRGELAAVTRLDGLEEGARRMMRELGLEFLVVTLGDRGMRVYRRKAEPFTLPAAARQVYDVTGAGDTALAAFGLGYASGLALEDCALLANAAAGVVVGKVGTETVTRGELLAQVSGGEGHRKIVSLPQLLEALAEERAHGRRIVLTNGCFDLLHAGHVSTLRFARSRGDVLVVGLNSDRSVRALKGVPRPYLPQEERARILAALEPVDYVVIFDETHVTNLVRRVRPDVLVKGGQYGLDGVVGRRYAGRVELAPHVRGVSTTEIARRIRENERTS